MRHTRLSYGIILGIVVASFVVFWPVLQAEFLFWDDNHNVYENAQITTLDADSLKWMFGGVGPDIRYKPLTYLTWASLQAGFGLKPFPYHITNLLLHAFNGVLLFLILRRLGNRIRPVEGGSTNDTDLLAGLWEVGFSSDRILGCFVGLHAFAVELSLAVGIFCGVFRDQCISLETPFGERPASARNDLGTRAVSVDRGFHDRGGGL